MTEIVFVFRDDSDAGKDDRDAVKYADLGRVGKFELGHYFVDFDITGACFFGGFRLEELPEEITTVLTREDFEALEQFNTAINALGYGIKEGDERYQRGLELVAGIQPILDKLRSEENEKLFEQVKAEEREYLKEKYSLDDADLDLIFEEAEYDDRAAISYVYDSIRDLSENEAKSLGLVNDAGEQYFDFEQYGQDLLDSGDYVELSDGRVVSLSR